MEGVAVFKFILKTKGISKWLSDDNWSTERLLYQLIVYKNTQYVAYDIKMFLHSISFLLQWFL